MGDARLRGRVQDLEAELSEMDACADELEAELDEAHSDGQALHSRVVQLEVAEYPLSPPGLSKQMEFTNCSQARLG